MFTASRANNHEDDSIKAAHPYNYKFLQILLSLHIQLQITHVEIMFAIALQAQTITYNPVSAARTSPK